jgi:uncharacterized Zn finger protein
MSWGYWRHYERAEPRPVENGIRTKSQRGAIGETWWSKRWIEALESLHEDARLARGRSYARRGQVVSISVQKGAVNAKVQGTQSKPYSVNICLTPLSDTDWKHVTDIMASQAIFGAKLLSGEMPQNIEEAFAQAKVSLFPASRKDLKTECSCPDWVNPCKHVAAVYYILAEKFDEDPFLIFKLRGRTKEEIIQVLREKRGKQHTRERQKQAQPKVLPETNIAYLEECSDSFWKAGEALASFTINPAEPEVNGAILKRLGNGPFTNEKENQDIIATLNRAYNIASKAALQTLKLG